MTRSPSSDFAFRLFALSGQARINRIGLRAMLDLSIAALELVRGDDELTLIVLAFLKLADTDPASAGAQAQRSLGTWMERNIPKDPRTDTAVAGLPLWQQRKDTGHD